MFNIILYPFTKGIAPPVTAVKNKVLSTNSFFDGNTNFPCSALFIAIPAPVIPSVVPVIVVINFLPTKSGIPPANLPKPIPPANDPAKIAPDFNPSDTPWST